MKLSDIKGERTLDVIADLIGPVCNIAMDDEAASLFKPRKPKKGQTPTQAFIERVREGAPKLLRDHRDDLVAILATIKGAEPAEYAGSMTLSGVVADVIELLSDEEFLVFLS